MATNVDIMGTVYTSSDKKKPASDITVIVTDGSGNKYTTTTDTDGDFEVDNVPFGGTFSYYTSGDTYLDPDSIELQPADGEGVMDTIPAD